MIENGRDGRCVRRPALWLVIALGAAVTACSSGAQPTPGIASSPATGLADVRTQGATAPARPSPSPVSTPIGSALWWNGFRITLDKATFTPDAGTAPNGGQPGGVLSVSGAAQNLTDQQRPFAGESDQPAVTVGGRSTALQQPVFDKVPSRGTIALNLEYRLDGPFDPAGTTVIFGSTDELQSTAVLMSGGAVQTVQPRRVQAGPKASTPVLALAVTGGTADASYRALEKGKYEVRVAVDVTYSGHASGGYYLAATQFTLTGAGSVVAAPREVDDLSAMPLPAGSVTVHTFVSFLLPQPPAPTLTISYDGKQGNGVTGTAELKVNLS